MKTGTKAWLIAACILILAGGLLFTFALHACHWDFANLSTTEFTSHTYEITESFRNIAINSTTADIVLVPSDTNMCTIECYEKTTAEHTVDILEGTLTIAVVEKLQLDNLISISASKPKITIYLPKKEYGDLTISLTTGNITIQQTSHTNITVNATTGKILMDEVFADSMEVSVRTGNITLEAIHCTGDISTQTTTGKMHLTDVRCNSLRSQGSTGDILLENVLAWDVISLTRTSGDILLESCDGSQLFLEVTTGDITGTLLTGKVFTTHTTTGTVEVPHSVTGGKCELSTTTGDIHIAIP